MQSIVEHSINLHESRIRVNFVHPEERLPLAESEADVAKIYVCHALAFLDLADDELCARLEEYGFTMCPLLGRPRTQIIVNV